MKTLSFSTSPGTRIVINQCKGVIIKKENAFHCLYDEERTFLEVRWDDGSISRETLQSLVDQGCLPDQELNEVKFMLPKLQIMRDAEPMTGQIWVVDENNHMVASFKIMRPECHLKGATSESVDVARNLMMAKALIAHLELFWKT